MSASRRNRSSSSRRMAVISEMAGTSNMVTSQQVGEETLKQLYPVSRVAYVRFASVYRAFDDLDQFIDEIEKLARPDQR